MVTIQHEGRLSVIGIFGRLELADFRQIEDEIQRQLDAVGQIDLLVDLRGMMGYTLDVALEDIRFVREHARDIGRIAMISENDAVVWAALLARLFVRAEIQVFDSESGGRDWLAAPPQSDAAAGANGLN